MAFDKRNWIMQAIRRASYKWPPRYTCKVNARVDRGKYLCNKCKEIVPNKEIQLDHIQPVAGTEGFTTWDDYIERMFPEIEGFQCLCIKCHQEKSAEENSVRRKHKAALTNIG